MHSGFRVSFCDLCGHLVWLPVAFRPRTRRKADLRSFTRRSRHRHSDDRIAKHRPYRNPENTRPEPASDNLFVVCSQEHREKAGVRTTRRESSPAGTPRRRGMGTADCADSHRSSTDNRPPGAVNRLSYHGDHREHGKRHRPMRYQAITIGTPWNSLIVNLRAGPVRPTFSISQRDVRRAQSFYSVVASI